MGGGEEGEHICAICLDPLTCGTLFLPCRHSFHSNCLLSAFSDTPAHWKCPCCRALVVTVSKKEQPTRKKSVAAGGVGTDDVFLTEDSEFLTLPPYCKHFYRPEGSRWATLQAFLAAAACALADVDQPNSSPLSPSSSATSKSRLRSPCHGKKSGNLHGSAVFSKGIAARSIAVMERICPPVASSITAFVGHTQLSRLLNPSLPHPAWRAVCYLCVVILSGLAVCGGVWALRWIMAVLGAGVCSVVDSFAVAIGSSPFEHACDPMVPEGWVLPIGFAFVGFYIALQVSWLYGVTSRQILLKWDECALRAVAVWFLFSLGYTLFVYVARLLLALLTTMLGPLPAGEACLPTLKNPC